MESVRLGEAQFRCGFFFGHITGKWLQSKAIEVALLQAGFRRAVTKLEDYYRSFVSQSRRPA